MESEVLSNLASYDKVTESIIVERLMESDATPVSRLLEALSNKYPGEDLTIDGRKARVNKVIDILIHRFVYVESMFGSEREFIDMMIKIVRSILV
ncbi:MAG: hypothetical protein PVH79_04515 [Candidatus Bathyarchaeota archaeon]|jgi:hypothetical protein